MQENKITEYPPWPSLRFMAKAEVLLTIMGTVFGLAILHFSPPPVQLEPTWIFIIEIDFGVAFYGGIAVLVGWLLGSMGRTDRVV